MRMIALSILSIPLALGFPAAAAAGDLDEEMYVESLGMRVRAKSGGSVYERMTRTCNEGVGVSCHFLGEFYRERNRPALAKKFHEKGCAGRHVRSCLILGSIYLFDEDDRRAAEEAFRYPCEQEESGGCHNLAYLAKLREDYGAARLLYAKACSLGLQRACEDLESLEK